MQEDEIIAEASPDKEEILFVRAALELILNERKQEPILKIFEKTFIRNCFVFCNFPYI